MNPLPDTFISSLPIPKEDLSDFLDALHQEPTVSIRLNNSKARLRQETTQVPWCPEGFVLPHRPRFTSDPAMHAGAYYPQEAASMFVSYVVKSLKFDERPIRVLDLCAAPGGKSGILRSTLHPESLLVSNEVIKSRVPLLEETLIKLGRPGFLVSSADPMAFTRLPHFFDLVVVDSPCSGEGLFRKQENALSHWSPEAVDMCAARQKRILDAIWSALKPGGQLVYSTCTYNRKENEENMLWMTHEHGATSQRLDISAFEGITETETEGLYGYRFMPHRTVGEGLFVAVLTRPDDEVPKKLKRTIPTLQKGSVPFLKASPYNAISGKDGHCYAILAEHFDDLNTVASHIHTTIPGMPVGRFYTSRFKPAHGLSQMLHTTGMPESVQLDHADAIKFLEKNDVTHSGSLKGLVSVEFEGFRLGFGKGGGNRIVSNYPRNWRILAGRPDKYHPLVEAIAY